MTVQKLKRGHYRVEINGINFYIQLKQMRRSNSFKTYKAWVLTNDKCDFDYDEFSTKAEALTFLELKYTK